MNCPDRQIDDHEDLIYTALPDYNPAACLLESDSEEDETEVKKFTTSLAMLAVFPTSRKRVVKDGLLLPTLQGIAALKGSIQSSTSCVLNCWGVHVIQQVL